MAKQKRVHNLAKELGVTSKAILEKCRAEGLELKNHMATLSAGLEATIREWFSEGSHETVEEKAERVDLTKVRKKTTRKKKTTKKAAAKKEEEAKEEEAPQEEAAAVTAEPAEVTAEKEKEEAKPEEPAVAVADAPAEAEVVEPAAEEEEPKGKKPRRKKKVAAEKEAEPEAEKEKAEPTPAVEAPPTVEEPPAEEEVEEPPKVAAEAPTTEPEAEVTPESEEELESMEPAGPQLTTPAPAQLQGPQVVRVEAPEPERRFRPRGPGRPGGPRGGRGIPMNLDVIPERPAGRQGKGGGSEAPPEEAKRGRAKNRFHPRRSKESIEAEERIREYRDRDLLEREERLKAAGERGGLRRRAADTAPSRAKGTVRPKADKIEVTEPIQMKELCSAMGIPFNRVFPKLMELGKMVRITDTIDRDTAKLIASDLNIELTVKESRTLMDELKEEFGKAEEEREDLVPRPPIVTFLGHVDHGKTSLLDAIRKSRLLDREAGGITQQIGAYRFAEDDVDVTFIDTPGHEAFTAMRSRGATMTDVVVLVVAADDGVMQTTREAIQHARAAEVPIVVALNKIDLPGVDLNRIYGQLAEENLTPTEWGGEVDVIKTSAITGEGIEDLLEHLTTLTELLDLKSDPSASATGWVVEAEEKRGQGIVATLLVKDGTLKAGSILVCGPASGRVRAMRDDRGKIVEEASPGTPVEVSGLDAVPVAGERFYQVEDLKRAKTIAGEQHDQMRVESLSELSKPRSLEELFREQQEGVVPELNVILRSDTHGKLETLKAELSRIPDEQVRLRIILDGIGAVTEGDVMLASTSGAIVIGFWVVAEENARRMAQDLGVDVRLYRVIYEVTDDIRKALEGLLEPEQKEEYRGRLEVRQVFNIGRVGKVAGCYVTDGTVSRNHRVRVIRDNAVVRDNCEIASLRRVKDDVREVRAGLECGLKIQGFDDVHAGDVLEAYEVLEVARTLSG